MLATDGADFADGGERVGWWKEDWPQKGQKAQIEIFVLYVPFVEKLSIGGDPE